MANDYPSQFSQEQKDQAFNRFVFSAAMLAGGAITSTAKASADLTSEILTTALDARDTAFGGKLYEDIPGNRPLQIAPGFVQSPYTPRVGQKGGQSSYLNSYFQNLSFSTSGSGGLTVSIGGGGAQGVNQPGGSIFTINGKLYDFGDHKSTPPVLLGAAPKSTK